MTTSTLCIITADVNVNESPVHLTICDTAGQDTLDPLRELCYPDSDVFLLCFSVVKPETFRAIKTKWAPKFAKTKAALILVGTQADLRTSPNVLNKLQVSRWEFFVMNMDLLICTCAARGWLNHYLSGCDSNIYEILIWFHLAGS